MIFLEIYEAFAYFPGLGCFVGEACTTSAQAAYIMPSWVPLIGGILLIISVISSMRKNYRLSIVLSLLIIVVFPVARYL